MIRSSSVAAVNHFVGIIRVDGAAVLLVSLHRRPGIEDKSPHIQCLLVDIHCVQYGWLISSPAVATRAHIGEMVKYVIAASSRALFAEEPVTCQPTRQQRGG